MLQINQCSQSSQAIQVKTQGLTLVYYQVIVNLFPKISFILLLNEHFSSTFNQFIDCVATNIRAKMKFD